jgi:hypothetical protein
MITDIQPIAEQLLTTFTTIVPELVRKYPDVRLHTFSGSVGSLTDYQGYHIGVECLFPDAQLDHDDLVVLTVDFRHITTTPEMNADVTWGRGHIDVAFSDAWAPVSEQTHAQLFASLPRLCAAFEQAIQRGMPNEETQTL